MRRPTPKRYRLNLRFLLVIATILAIPIFGLPATASASKVEAITPVVHADPQLIDNIDPEILATMRHQEKFQPAVQLIYGEYAKDESGGFAGIAFEGDGLTLYYKGKLTAAMSKALEKARTVGAVVLKPARYSKAELVAEGDKIHNAIDSYGASEIQTIGYMYDGSGLKVEKKPNLAARGPVGLANAPRERVATAEKILADADVRVPVEISIAEDPFVLLASRLDDNAPWNGGGRWEAWRGTEHRSTCSTGFGVNASGRTWILSAAHCASLGDIAYQGVFGGGSGTGFSQMGPINSDQWAYDLLLIDTPGWYLIFDGSPTTSNTKRVYSWGYWATNELVCQSGMRSGVVCGIRQEYSEDVRVSCNTPDSDGDCDYVLRGMIHSFKDGGGIAARSGDSGGPVFTLDGNGVRAKGIVSGGSASGNKMVFQDWHDVIRLFGAYPRTP